MAKILIVEDDKDLNYAYTVVLRNQQHHVESVFNGEEAIHKMDEFHPDLILLDLLMPIKSGVEFLRETDILHTDTSIRIVVFTNLENATDIGEARRLGANKVIIKSWTGPQGLIDIVDDVLSAEVSAGRTVFQEAA